MKNTLLIISLFLVLILTSCATIFSGTQQNVKFSSNPSVATVFIDNIEVGKTPFEIKLNRNKEHNIMLKLEGYQTYQTSITKKINGWFWGNILIGGLIGVIVDTSTGAMYKLTPKEINAEMNNGIVFKSYGKDIFIAISLDIDPNWEKIGQLEKVIQ